MEEEHQKPKWWYVAKKEKVIKICSSWKECLKNTNPKRPRFKKFSDRRAAEECAEAWRHNARVPPPEDPLIPARNPPDPNIEPLVVCTECAVTTLQNGARIGCWGFWFSADDPRNVSGRFPFRGLDMDRIESFAAMKALQTIYDPDDPLVVAEDQEVTIITPNPMLIRMLRKGIRDPRGCRGFIRTILGYMRDYPVSFLWMEEEGDVDESS